MTAQVVDVGQRLVAGDGKDDVAVVLNVCLNVLWTEDVSQIAQQVFVAQHGRVPKRRVADVELDLFDLSDGLRAEQSVEFAVVLCHLVE